MSKDIIPLKIIIDFNDLGGYKQALLAYRVKSSSGEILRKINTISLSSIMPVPTISGILNSAKIFAKNQENKTKE